MVCLSPGWKPPKICITSTYMSALLTIRERVSPHVGCAASCCPAAGAEGAGASAIVEKDAGRARPSLWERAPRDHAA